LAVSSITSTGLTLTWTGGGGETSFRIYGSPNNGVYAVLGTLAAGITSLTLATLTPSTSYSFKVSGVNVDGEGAASNVVSAVTAGITPVTSTPTLGMTFQDLIVRVAEYLGVADYSGTTAGVPTDAHDLDLCKRLVNDGYARFVAERNWHFLKGEMTVTPDGINYVFDLPADFEGEFLTTWTYPVTGPITQMRQTSEQHIRALRAGTNTTGYPTLFAIQPKDAVNATTDTARWQVVFWPTPYDNTLLLTAKYRRFPMRLVNLTDRSVAGPVHDQGVKQAAIAAAEIQRYGEAGPQEQLYQTLLARSMRKDDATVPDNLGDYGDRSDDGALYGRRRPRDQYRVSTYNGVSVLDVGP
jgi:hypothetical protein